MAKKGHFLIGFVIGGAVAFAAATLLAPKTGAQLTDKLKKKSAGGKDRAMDYYRYATDLGDSLRDQAGDKIEDLKATLADLTGSINAKHEEAMKPDRDAFDAATDALGDDLGQAEDNADDEDFDDIVIDGKSAFEAAKESADADQSQTATDTNPQAVDPAPAAESAQSAAPASAVQTPETPQAPTDSADQQ
ncbi:YtxH domain-containing protein [Schleiferilactobacillus harbinensis]|uniref:YtxH domain-containing protein n=1 Tax=Schleiferilactobacillus harbinensis TaxID=304207 RepID=UPI0039E78E5D